MNEKENHVKFVIVGSGFAGLTMAIRLKQAGENDFVILERASEVGGVWRENRYPGCACDVPSYLYSLSFAPNTNWTRKYSPQPEIFSYIKNCVDKFSLQTHLRLQHEVLRMDWQEDQGQWRTQTSQGVFHSQFVMRAVGTLSVPSIPPMLGIEKFKGQTFHSASWPQDFKAQRRNVAVIGTGASAAQFIPEIQPQVSSLQVFQRTPVWVLPRNDQPVSSFMRKVFQAVPLLQKLTRLKLYLQFEFAVLGFLHPRLMELAQKKAVKFLENSVSDPALRARLTPNYILGCKRILLSDTYFPALTQPNVEVIDKRIRAVVAEGIVTEDGRTHVVDTIIFGTGFKTGDMPISRVVWGQGEKNMAQQWKGSPSAYLGITVKDFPNFFMLSGPHTGVGHTSLLYMLECQVEHILKVVTEMKKLNVQIIEPRAEAQKDFVQMVDRVMSKTVWVLGGCKSWYEDITGRQSILWPGFTFRFRQLTAKARMNQYELRRVDNKGAQS
jgi:cation diffusion facilitator CzcD-associated flavoprotein CzcO